MVQWTPSHPSHGNDRSKHPTGLSDLVDPFATHRLRNIRTSHLSEAAGKQGKPKATDTYFPREAHPMDFGRHPSKQLQADPESLEGLTTAWRIEERHLYLWLWLSWGGVGGLLLFCFCVLSLFAQASCVASLLFCLPACLFVSLSACVFLCLFVCLFVRLLVCLFLFALFWLQMLLAC